MPKGRRNTFSKKGSEKIVRNIFAKMKNTSFGCFLG
jgi:hypothetical protein